eukprot:1787610-Rhodomonas_salina.4
MMIWRGEDVRSHIGAEDHADVVWSDGGVFASTQEIKSLEFGTHGNMQTGKARFLLNCDAVYKRAVAMLQERSFE